MTPHTIPTSKAVRTAKRKPPSPRITAEQADRVRTYVNLGYSAKRVSEITEVPLPICRVFKASGFLPVCLSVRSRSNELGFRDACKKVFGR